MHCVGKIYIVGQLQHLRGQLAKEQNKAKTHMTLRNKMGQYGKKCGMNMAQSHPFNFTDSYSTIGQS